MNTSNTHPETIVDKNGKVTTVHKKSVGEPSKKRLPAPSTPTQAGKAITITQRVSESTDEQKVLFDLLSAIAKSSHDAKEITIAESSRGLVVTEIDGESVAPNVIMDYVARDAVARGGIYRLGPLQKSTIQKVGEIYDRRRFNVAANSKLSEPEQVVLSKIVSDSQDPSELRSAYELDDFIGTRRMLAWNTALPRDLVEQLAADQEPMLRDAVAQKSTQLDVVRRLRNDPSNAVVSTVISRDVLSEDEAIEVYANRRGALEIETAFAERSTTPPRILLDIVKTSTRSENVAKAQANMTSRSIARVYGAGDMFTSSIEQEFFKNNQLGVSAAVDYHRNHRDEPIGLSSQISPSQARSVAWRVAKESPVEQYPAIHALSTGTPFPLQKLAEESSQLAHARELGFGLRQSGRDFGQALFLWSRANQAGR